MNTKRMLNSQLEEYRDLIILFLEKNGRTLVGDIELDIEDGGIIFRKENGHWLPAPTAFGGISYLLERLPDEFINKL